MLMMVVVDFVVIVLEDFEEKKQFVIQMINLMILRFLFVFFNYLFVFSIVVTIGLDLKQQKQKTESLSKL